MSSNKPRSYYQGDRPEMIQYVPRNSKRILDVGCSEGGFGGLLQNKNREVWGIEPHTQAAMVAESRLHRVLNGTIESELTALPDDYFDLIVFNDVLEHLVEPGMVLKNVMKKLNKDGALLASIPNLRFARILHGLLFEKDFKYTEFGILDYTHLRFFTKNSMVRLFEESGYEIEFIHGLDRTPSWRSFLLIMYFKLVTLSNCQDMFYTGYCLLARKGK